MAIRIHREMTLKDLGTMLSGTHEYHEKTIAIMEYLLAQMRAGTIRFHNYQLRFNRLDPDLDDVGILNGRIGASPFLVQPATRTWELTLIEYPSIPDDTSLPDNEWEANVQQ